MRKTKTTKGKKADVEQHVQVFWLVPSHFMGGGGAEIETDNKYFTFYNIRNPRTNNYFPTLI